MQTCSVSSRGDRVRLVIRTVVAARHVAYIRATIVPGIVLQNAPSSDVFSHNRTPRSRHANVGCHFDSCAAHNLGGRGVGSNSDQRPAVGAQVQLNARF
jgi:hypothetical protein